MPFLFVTDDKVIISYAEAKDGYGQDDNFDSSLTALFLESGQIIWQTRLADPGYGTDIDSARLDIDRLYLAYSFQVSAFSLKTGELLWSTPSFAGHTGYDFRPWDSGDPLLLHTTDREVIAIDPRTGQVLSRQPDGELIQTPLIEFQLTPTGLHAVDRQTGRVLWTRVLEAQPAYRQLMRWPSFVEDDILFEEGAPCFKIIRTDILSGQVVWETPERNYLSNFALAGARAYALREDTTLVAFDLNSGEIIGTLKFDGPPARTICAKSGSDVYWVVANGAYVLVYFGDSQDLIAFKVKNELQP